MAGAVEQRLALVLEQVIAGDRRIGDELTRAECAGSQKRIVQAQLQDRDAEPLRQGQPGVACGHAFEPDAEGMMAQ